MVNGNSEPRSTKNVNIKPTNLQELAEYLRKDIQKNPQPYIALSTLVLGSMYIGYKLKRTPTEAQVLNKWLAEANAAGFSIYGLTNEQKKLWETIWQYVEAESKQYGLPVSKVVGELIADYTSVSRYRGTFPRSA